MPNRPSKKKNDTTFQEEAAAKEQVLRAKAEQRVAEQIKDVLDANGYALQPFLSFSEYGVVPRVRLVENPEAPKADEQPTDTNDNGTDTPESGEDKADTEPTESDES